MLVHPPFADVRQPCLGLSLLKAALVSAGHQASVLYLNLTFARRIGLASYEEINTCDASLLLGEWIFANALDCNHCPDAKDYFLSVLAQSPHTRQSGSSSVRSDTEAVISGLSWLRNSARAFLERFEELADWSQYEVIGIGTSFHQTAASLALAKRLKFAYPSRYLVLGGANCEGEMGDALLESYPFLDAVCSGEGDTAFVQLVDAVANARTRVSIPGIRTRRALIQRSDELICNPSPVDLNTTPYPDFDDYFNQRCAIDEIADAPITLPIESSRGCWWGAKHHCTFCGLNGELMHPRTKTPDRFLAELDYLRDRYSCASFSASDNILPHSYLKNVLPRLATRTPPLRLFYEVKANLREQDVALLWRAGVHSIQPGIESLDSKALHIMRKGTTALQNIRLLRWCAEYMVEPLWNLLYGFPTDSHETYTNQASLIASLTHLPPPIALAKVRIVRFSPLYREALQSGQPLSPLKAYEFCFKGDITLLGRMAYFFQTQSETIPTLNSAYSALADATHMWQSTSETGKLLELDDGQNIFIQDDRSNDEQNFCLKGHEANIYRICRNGASRSQLLEHRIPEGFSSDSLEKYLRWLVEARLVVFVDDHYLTLPVSAHQYVSRDVEAMRVRQRTTPSLTTFARLKTRSNL